MSSGHLTPAPLALYTEILPLQADIPEWEKVFSLGRQVAEKSSLPAKGVGLRKTEMSQHAVSKLASHFI